MILILPAKSNAMRKNEYSGSALNHQMTEEQGMELYTPASLSLDSRGYIQTCSRPVEKLFGYRQHELLWQHISCLFPQFFEVARIQGERLNPLLNYLCHCDHDFEAIDKQGEAIICNLNLFLVENDGQQSLRLIVRPLVSANQ